MYVYDETTQSHILFRSLGFNGKRRERRRIPVYKNEIKTKTKRGGGNLLPQQYPFRDLLMVNVTCNNNWYTFDTIYVNNAAFICLALNKGYVNDWSARSRDDRD